MVIKADTKRAESQAKIQLERIIEMVKALDTQDDDARESALQTINEDPLSVEIRSDWHTPGAKSENTEYRILLCTGGPAVRITGDLGCFSEPDSAQLEYQDWFTPWEKLYDTTPEQDEALLQYARQFYFSS